MSQLAKDLIVQGHAEQTPAADLAAALNANVLHHNDIKITGTNQDVTLHHLLVARWAVLGQTANGTWVGPIESHVESLDPSHPVVPAWGQLLAFMAIVDQWAYTSRDNNIASVVEYLIPQVAAASPYPHVTQESVRADIESVTGGRQIPRADYTEAEIQEEYDALEAEAANAARLAERETILAGVPQHYEDQITALRAQFDADVAVIVGHQNNAAASMADTQSLTNEELQTRADQVITSADGVVA
jgi:hypothetical protein